ncbi:MAG TPA: YciI family protein [Pseudonocardiaceae bacterium]
MKYLLFLYERDTDWESVPAETLRSALAEHAKFAAYLRERGTEYSGHALRPSTDATTLRRAADGELLVTDGPYVELTEHIGGIYVIEAADLDEALEIARRCPTGTGTEIRPIWE